MPFRTDRSAATVFPDIDWSSVFGLTMNPLELVARGSAMFWFLYALFRFVLRRDVGSIAMADILILVIIADASQNAMAGEYRSVSDGMVLVGTIVGWNVLVDWLAFRYEWLRRILEAPMVVLVRNGRMQRNALKAQLMSVDELRAKLRDAGIESISDVKLATFESNGDFTVIKRKHRASMKSSRQTQLFEAPERAAARPRLPAGIHHARAGSGNHREHRAAALSPGALPAISRPAAGRPLPSRSGNRALRQG